MPFVLILLLLLPPVLACAALFGQKFEAALPFTLLVFITTGYFFAICGLLRFFPYVYYLLWGASLAYLAFRALFRRNLPYGKLFSLGFVLFLAFAALFWWICRGRMVTFWDDFSHWALSIKNMYYLDNLYTHSASTATYQDYPPAAQILQYTFLKAGRFAFREDVCLFVHGLLQFSLLLFPVCRFTYRQTLPACLMAGLLFLLVPSLNTGAYSRLLVDGLLGIFTAFILLVWLVLPKAPFSRALILLGCFTLSILKASGLGLALMAATVILAGQLIPALKSRRRLSAPFIAGLAAPFGAALAAWASWAIHKAAWQVPRQWNVGSINLASLWELFTGNAPEYRYQVLRNFISTFFLDPGHGWLLKFPSVGWLFIFALFYLFTRLLLPPERRQRYTIGAVGVAGIYLFFMLGLMLNYMFVFSQGEGLILAHMYRYQTTATVGAMAYYISCLFLTLRPLPLLKQAAAGAAAIGAALCLYTELYWVVDMVRRAPTYAADTQNQRFFSLQNAQRIERLGEEQPRVYFVSITDYGWALMQLRYQLAPGTISNPDQNTSLAAFDYYGADSGSLIISPEDWAALLYENYDYVYLFSIDGYFTSYYSLLFENEDDCVNDTMLAVIRHEDKTISLRKLY